MRLTLLPLVAILLPLAAASAVDIEGGDAHATLLAVSLTGNASNTHCGDSSDGCVAIAPMGRASNDGCTYADETALMGCVAIADQNATNDGCNVFFADVLVNCLAVSAHGDAANGPCFRGGTLPSDAHVVLVGCLAVSGSGSARSSCTSIGPSIAFCRGVSGQGVVPAGAGATL